MVSDIRRYEVYGFKRILRERKSEDTTSVCNVVCPNEMYRNVGVHRGQNCRKRR